MFVYISIKRCTCSRVAIPKIIQETTGFEITTNICSCSCCLLHRFCVFYRRKWNRYSVATSWATQILVVAQIVSKVKTLQNYVLMFQPKILQTPVWTNMVGMNCRSHKKNVNADLNALPSFVITCQLHHKLIVILATHGTKWFSHPCTMQTYVFQLFSANGICNM